MNTSFYGFGPTDDEARSYRPAGLVGARAAARLAGATPSGAPTAGSFRKGDAIWGQDGSLWICTVAGSPGTFVQAGFTNPLTTKADLIVGAAAGAASRLGVGSDNQVLTADSTQTLGVKWAVTSANAGGALTQIAQTVLSSTTASITFSSIPGTYSALLVLWTARSVYAGSTQDNLELQFNSDTAAHYDDERVMGFGSSSQFFSDTAQSSANVAPIPAANAASALAGSGDLRIPNYAGTTFEKDAFSQFTQVLGTGSTDIRVGLMSQHWRSSAAITSIKLFATSGSLASGTVMTLYGVS